MVESNLEMGTVPAWISAAVALAGVGWAIRSFSINMAANESVPANSVMCRLEDESIVIENCSTVPIDGLAAIVWCDGRPHGVDLPSAVLKPGERVVVEERADDVSITFRDPRGIAWSKKPGERAKRLKE